VRLGFKILQQDEAEVCGSASRKFCADAIFAEIVALFPHEPSGSSPAFAF